MPNSVAGERPKSVAGPYQIALQMTVSLSSASVIGRDSASVFVILLPPSCSAKDRAFATYLGHCWDHLSEVRPREPSQELLESGERPPFLLGGVELEASPLISTPWESAARRWGMRGIRFYSWAR